MISVVAGQWCIPKEGVMSEELLKEVTQMKYDLIGDIHGQLDLLRQLRQMISHNGELSDKMLPELVLKYARKYSLYR